MMSSLRSWPYCRSIKSFVRFKCISKLWLALTLDPSYNGKFPHIASGIFFRDLENFYISLSTSSSSSLSVDTCTINTTLNFLPYHEYWDAIKCCNGLILVRARDNVNPRGQDRDCYSYYACNPATGEWAAIPMFREEVYVQELAFNPHVSQHYHLLGHLMNNGRIMIFSSKKRDWTTMVLPDAVKYRDFDYSTISFRGVLHVIDNKRQTIVGFNLEKGKACKIINLPKSDMRVRCMDFRGRCFFVDEGFRSRRSIYLRSRPVCGIGFSQGYFHYALEDEDDMKVWILEDYDRCSGWVLKYSIDLKEMIETHGFEYRPYVARHLCYMRFLAFHPDMDVVFLLVRQTKMLAYHKNSGRSEEIYSSSSSSISSICGQGLFVYSPCLSNGLLGSERA